MSVSAAVRAGPGRGGAPAVRSAGVNLTYAGLLDAAARLGEDLARLTPPGVPVVAAVRDLAATAVLGLACDLAGLVVVHTDPDAPRPPGGLRVRDRPTGSPADEGRHALLEPGGGLRLTVSREGEPPVLTGVPTGAQVFLTSGSTGAPSAVVRPGAALLADADRVATGLRYGPDVAVVASAPAFHVYGFAYAVLGPLSRGAAVRPVGVRSVPSQLARAVRATGAQVLVAHPFQYGLLAAGRERLGPLRRAVSAGAPLPAGVAAAVHDRYALTLLNCYGSSEAGAVTLTPVTGAEPAGDAGAPLPGVRVSLAPVDGIGAGGELLVASDSLADGRLGPAGMVPLTSDGRYRTGDLAELVAGRIRLRGRLGAVINVAGEKVSPAEVEQAIAGHPRVRDVQVVAMADPRRGGQVPLARVVADGLDAADLLEWCRRLLAPAHLPRRIDFVPELPRTATGKPVLPRPPEGPS